MRKRKKETSLIRGGVIGLQKKIMTAERIEKRDSTFSWWSGSVRGSVSKRINRHEINGGDYKRESGVLICPQK